MALTKIPNGMSGANAADTIFNNDKQAPIIWETGQYDQNRTVMHIATGRMYYAAVNITTPTVEPGSNANWVELLTGYTKAEKLGFLLNNPANVTLDQTAGTLTFTGSTNIVVGQRNRYLVSAGTIDLTTVSGEFVILAINRSTGAVSLYTSSNVVGIPDTHMIFGGVRKGSGKWLLTNISNYTYLPAPTPTNNKFFEPGTVSLAESINNAIISMEWYDIADTEYVTFYAVGKQYQFSGTEKRDYLGFRLGATTEPVVNVTLGPVEWGGNFYQSNVDPAPSGIKTYTYKRSNGALLGTVTINWDLISTGYRLIQTTSAASNDKVLRYTFKKSSVSAIKRSNAIISDVELDKYYDTETTADYSNASGTSVPTGLADVNSFYALWDAMLADNPGYITKTLLTDQVPTETTPLSMFAYTFDPPITRNDDATVSNPVFKPTIFINTALHGFEKTGALCNYELIKQMLTNWKSDPFLEYLRWNAKIIVIPSGNPWGWNTLSGAGARKNYRGVDLNRNFPVGWTLGNPGDATYGGPSPLSEVESQAIYNFTNSIQGPFIGLDFHNFHGSVQADPRNYNTAWLEAASNFMIDIGYATSRVTTRKFREKTSVLPPDANWLAMTTSLGLGAGKLSAHLNNLNMYSGTFEVAQNFRFAAGFKPHDANAIKFGTESWGNFLRLTVKNALLDYNIKH